ncbi:hypothetical protein L2D01_08575 [Hyphomonadaceae bacterium ML37]|nr:hypothetical protein L2D01_08575 [Hyphomonadaceae bacterium ML37]
MILDNLTRAFKTQNWLAVATEFVIVIAGVVIGFQINAWAEGRSDRAAEQAILLQLHDDFAELRATEEAYLARAAQQQRLSALWISALEGPEPPGMAGLRQIVLDFYEAEDPERRAVLERGPLHNIFTDPIGGERQPAASVVFQQLVASGDLRLLRSQRLRAALTRRELQREQSVTALDRNRTASGFPMAEVFLEPVFQAGSPDPVATLNAAMARPEFAAGLRTFVGVKTYNEQWYRFTYEETLAVLAVLEEESP